MRANSTVQNAVIFVDSSRRDKSAWPKPSEFTIQFDEPYANVVSVTVLDATIPATMYVVDDHNNTLRLFCRISGTSKTLVDFEAALLDMQDVPAVRKLFDEASPTQIRLKIFDGIQDTGGQQTENSLEPPAVGVFRNSAQIHPERGLYPEGYVDGLVSLAGGDVKRYRLRADSMTHAGPPPASSVFRDDKGFSMVALTVVTNSYAELDDGTDGDMRFAASYSLWNEDDADYTFPAEATSYTLSHDKNDSAFFLVSHTINGVSGGRFGDHLHELAIYTAVVEPGNYDAKGFMTAFEHAMPTDIDDPDAPKMIGIETRSEVFLPGDREFMQYSSAVKYTSRFPFWFDMEHSGLDEVMGFTELPSDSADGDHSRLRFSSNKRLFGSVAAVTGSVAGDPEPALNQTKAWVIMPPGALNLNGTRFILLRCPQIECATSALSAQSVSTGIGLFKLYDQSLAHLRFDFVKLSTVDFHPIGKLSRLHLRFERLEGGLYDFKGSDFHILMVVRFLQRVRPTYSGRRVPRGSGERCNGERKQAIAGHHLNPDYDPDVLAYSSRAREDLDESDTESDEGLIEDPEHRERFEKARLRIAVAESRFRRGGARSPTDACNGRAPGDPSTGSEGREEDGDETSESSWRRSTGTGSEREMDSESASYGASEDDRGDG